MSTEHSDAIKRIFTIAEGHVQEKFTDKLECQLITEIYDKCLKHFKDKKSYPYTINGVEYTKKQLEAVGKK